MNFPVEFQIGPASLSAHFVFEVLAFIVGYRYYLFLRKRQPDQINTRNRVWILIGAAFGAFLFSRILGGLENPPEFFSGGHDLVFYYANRTIVGALLGGLLCVELTKKLIGEKSSSGDLFTFPLILGIMIGRIGCFSAGVAEPTYGLPSSMPWAMNLGDGLLRHPVALYEIFFLALLWCGLVLLEKRYTLKSGTRFALFMAGYLAYRFFVDFLKPGFDVAVGLTSIQIACLLGLLYYGILLRALFVSPSSIITRNHA